MTWTPTARLLPESSNTFLEIKTRRDLMRIGRRLLRSLIRTETDRSTLRSSRE